METLSEVVEKTISNIRFLCEDVCANGGTIQEDLEFRHHPVEGVGIFTTIDLPPGVALIKIPYYLCLSVDMISCDQHLSKLLKQNPGLLDYPDEILALGIMYSVSESNQCEWSQHVKTFPTTINTTLFWSAEELDELKGSNLYHLTNLLKRQMQSDWTNIHEPLSKEYPFLGHITLELYQWALSMVYSRAIGVTRNKIYTRIIPPVIDLVSTKFCFFSTSMLLFINII